MNDWVDAIASRPAWMGDAECQYVPDLPWIEEPKDTVGRPRELMARVCLECAVLAECDAYASSPAVVAGFWAGRHRAAGFYERRIAGRPSWWPAEGTGGAA